MSAISLEGAEVEMVEESAGTCAEPVNLLARFVRYLAILRSRDEVASLLGSGQDDLEEGVMGKLDAAGCELERLLVGAEAWTCCAAASCWFCRNCM